LPSARPTLLRGSKVGVANLAGALLKIGRNANLGVS